MTSEFETIFSRFRGKVTDYDFLSYSDADLQTIQTDMLKAACAKPRVRQIFRTYGFDEDFQELTFELRNPVDDFSDAEYVTELLALGMAIEWYQPKIDDILYGAPMIGGKEEKKLIDSRKENIQRLDSMKVEQAKMIRDYGYMYNSYIKDYD